MCLLPSKQRLSSLLSTFLFSLGGDLTSMVTAVLQSKTLSFPRTPPMKQAWLPPPRPNRSSRPAQPKPRSGRKVSSADKENRTVIKSPSKPLVMEEVTILKRGENLKLAVDRRSNGGGEPAHCSTGRIGPEPEILTKQIRFADSKLVYAGPGFFSSPAPSSLPFPAIFIKRDRTAEATRDLREFLHLDNLP